MNVEEKGGMLVITDDNGNLIIEVPVPESGDSSLPDALSDADKMLKPEKGVRAGSSEEPEDDSAESATPDESFEEKRMRSIRKAMGTDAEDPTKLATQLGTSAIEYERTPESPGAGDMLYNDALDAAEAAATDNSTQQALAAALSDIAVKWPEAFNAIMAALESPSADYQPPGPKVGEVVSEPKDEFLGGSDKPAGA